MTLSINSPENYYYMTTNNLIDSFKTIQLLLREEILLRKVINQDIRGVNPSLEGSELTLDPLRSCVPSSCNWAFYRYFHYKKKCNAQYKYSYWVWHSFLFFCHMLPTRVQKLPTSPLMQPSVYPHLIAYNSLWLTSYHFLPAWTTKEWKHFHGDQLRLFQDALFTPPWFHFIDFPLTLGFCSHSQAQHSRG